MLVLHILNVCGLALKSEAWCFFVRFLQFLCKKRQTVMFFWNVCTNSLELNGLYAL